MIPTLGQDLRAAAPAFIIGLAGVLLGAKFFIILPCALSSCSTRPNLALVAFSRYNLTIRGMPNL